MKSLFLRIFLSFWMAFALFLVVALLATLALRPRSSTWEALRTTVLNDAVNAYEQGGEIQLRQTVGQRQPRESQHCNDQTSADPAKPGHTASLGAAQTNRMINAITNA